SAHKLINSVEPKGKTNALAAIEKALRIRDNNANAPAVIYFLTDGFELAGLEGRQFTSEVAELLKKFAPTSKINTIGFWPQRSDRDILSTIALQSNGRAVFITEENFNLGND
ncbi:MAG: vWA domain-containing protein, partial [Planctomycetota bacterium]